MPLDFDNIIYSIREYIQEIKRISEYHDERLESIYKWNELKDYEIVLQNRDILDNIDDLLDYLDAIEDDLEEE